jgi:hypothetical protein
MIEPFLAIAGGIANLLGVSRWMIAGAILAVAGLLTYYAVSSVYDGIWQRGHDVADMEWKTAIAEEKERIAKENEAALSESRRRIAELNALLAKLEEDLRNADEEAHLDPNADRECLGTGSVQRLNHIH